MEVIRKVIDSDLLDGVVSLPIGFKNKKVEIIIFPTEEETALPSISKSNIDTMLKGSVTESLIGSLPYSEIPLEDYRSERLNKYERVD